MVFFTLRTHWLTLLCRIHGWLFAVLGSVSVGTAVITWQVPCCPFLPTVSHDAMGLVKAEPLLLVMWQRAVAVEGRRYHHWVGEWCSACAGVAGRCYQGAEMEQRTQGEEWGPGWERLQVAGCGVSRERPVGAAVPSTTARTANTYGRTVTRTLIQWRSRGGRRRGAGGMLGWVVSVARDCSHRNCACCCHGNIATSTTGAASLRGGFWGGAGGGSGERREGGWGYRGVRVKSRWRRGGRGWEVEVDRGVGNVVVAVGGGGQSAAGFYHQTNTTSRKTTTNHRVLESRRAIHVDPGEQVFPSYPHPSPHPEPWTEACTGHRKARAQRLSPVLCGQRRGPWLARGGEDACWVWDRGEQRLWVTALWVISRLREAEGEVGGACGRKRRSWIGLDGQNLGCGATGACRVQNEHAGPILLWTTSCCIWSQHTWKRFVFI